MSDTNPPDPTRRIDPDSTRRVAPGDARAGADRDPTQRIDLGEGAGERRAREPWEGVATPGAHGDQRSDHLATDAEPAGPDREQEEGGRRHLLYGVGGLVLGFVLAFLIIALGTSDPTDGDVAASSERIAALEADLDERDARIEALEARVADAEAAVGDSDADLAAQRQALDERGAALDDRAEAIEDRTAALDRRESELDERERAIADREQRADEPTGEEDDGEGGLLPDLDTEEVETFIDRVLERIRDLF